MLLGTLLFVGIAMAAIFAALRIDGLEWDLAIGLVVATVFAIVLGFRMPNEGWRRLAQAINFTVGSDNGATPLLIAMLVLGIIGAVIGLIAGSRVSAGGAVGGAILGALAGVLLGAFSAIGFDRRAGVASGIAIGLVAWQVAMAARVARSGVDTEELKHRYWPEQTIETAKETIEWVRARTPLGPRS